VLAGGVGAARFLRGLIRVADPSALTIVVNTGDDERFFGLAVSPDLDTISYTLAGVANPRTGWGVRGDTFACLDALGRFYGAPWFRLGDRDLATHLYRTERLAHGATLSTITAEICKRLGAVPRILPMSNDPVRTVLETSAGRLPFQRYLVAHHARPTVRRVRYEGAARARPAPGVLSAIRRAAAVIIAPSNPFFSIGPILAVPGVHRALANRRGPVVAVSPLVGGRAVRGPLDRMLRGLGLEASPRGIARLYRGLVDVFVLDRRDEAHAGDVAALGMRPVVTETIMRTPAHARRLAAVVLRALETPTRAPRR
jgi:LPPG:FO 2-phospho-L-lactate transferase